MYQRSLYADSSVTRQAPSSGCRIRARPARWRIASYATTPEHVAATTASVASAGSTIAAEREQHHRPDRPPPKDVARRPEEKRDVPDQVQRGAATQRGRGHDEE